MPHINLLPWRQEQRKERQRQFFTIGGLSLVLMVLIIFVVHLQVAGWISKQESRNARLEREIKLVEEQLKEIADLEKDRAKLLARMDIIQQLQRDRAEIVHLFDEIARSVPDGVNLTGFKQSNRTLTVQGMAQSNARVSSFMRNIDASEWLGNPNLDLIKADPKNTDKSSSFTLRSNQITPSKLGAGVEK